LVALGIAIPALTVVPAITLAFEGIAQWAELLTRIAVNLLLTAMALLGLLVVLRVIEAVAKRRR
jgi:threonine/homoserine efflux transporter RhtA